MTAVVVVRVYNTTGCADGACVRISVKVQTAAGESSFGPFRSASGKKNIINRLMTGACVYYYYFYYYCYRTYFSSSRRYNIIIISLQRVYAWWYIGTRYNNMHSWTSNTVNDFQNNTHCPHYNIITFTFHTNT